MFLIYYLKGHRRNSMKRIDNESCLIIQLPYFEDKNVMSNFFLSENSKRIFIKRVVQFFKITFHSEINKAILLKIKKKMQSVILLKSMNYLQTLLICSRRITSDIWTTKIIIGIKSWKEKEQKYYVSLNVFLSFYCLMLYLLYLLYFLIIKKWNQ